MDNVQDGDCGSENEHVVLALFNFDQLNSSCKIWHDLFIYDLNKVYYFCIVYCNYII